MGNVWRAHDTKLKRDVALKRLGFALADNPEFRERFRREAESVAGLNHPNIVSLYDTGEFVEANGATVPYLVMELVEGKTLRELLKAQGRLAEREALAIVRKVLEALGHAHSQGIIHRDIQPMNVMVDTSGWVKVMDFGIARAGDISGRLTSTSVVIGTPQYISPEQAMGQKADHRSDIYSTGCLLFELLTGRPPFGAESAVSLLYQHIHVAPSMASLVESEVSEGASRICAKALAKDRQERYQSAAEMIADIDLVLEGQGASTVRMPTLDVPNEEPVEEVALGESGQGQPPSDQIEPAPLSVSELAIAQPLRPVEALRPVEVVALQEPESITKPKGRLLLVIGLAILLVAGGISTWAILFQASPDAAEITLGDQTYATTITKLNLYGLGLTDSEIEPLKLLTSLTELDLGYNQISDLSPLAELTKLEILAVNINQIADLTPLKGLVNLKELNLASNKIINPSPLTKLTNLRELNLSWNEIDDLGGLIDLTELKELWLTSNVLTTPQVDDLAAELPNCTVHW
jgi:serine/threonine-protein kinase